MSLKINEEKIKYLKVSRNKSNLTIIGDYDFEGVISFSFKYHGNRVPK